MIIIINVSIGMISPFPICLRLYVDKGASLLLPSLPPSLSPSLSLSLSALVERRRPFFIKSRERLNVTMLA